MSYASISIDRRESYYERAAKLIAADLTGFYARAEAGRRIQSGIKPGDLKPFKPAPKVEAPSNVSPIRRARHAR